MSQRVCIFGELKNILQDPPQSLLLRLLELRDENGQQVGGLGPGALGPAVTVTLGQAAHNLVPRELMNVAVANIVPLVRPRSTVDRARVEMVGGNRDFSDAGWYAAWGCRLVAAIQARA